ncbi:hypothetical protein DVH24_018659 [Malus domestica]|uniref:FH2 domain-containing protein n=1 Tax=Malus domestica TaxID=3750 RepID=A0A498HLZ1_MALDO|nr:hypothetical protein DVH24_018659 [Malus domestica]
MLDGNIVNVSVPEAASSNEDNFLWDGLWNLNDVRTNFINTTRQSYLRQMIKWIEDKMDR